LAYTGTGLGRRSSIKAKIFWNTIFNAAFLVPRSGLIAEAGVIAPHMGEESTTAPPWSKKL